MNEITFNGQTQIDIKHSGLGISSFIISILSFIFFFGLFSFIGFLEVSTPGGLPETSPIFFIMGIVIALGLFTCFIGTGLGIAGSCMKDKKKIFSILGLIFNGCILLSVLFLMIIGIITG